jgi:hypothetical protein
MNKQTGSSGLVIALQGKGGCRVRSQMAGDWRDASKSRKGMANADLIFGEEGQAAMLR